MSTDGEQLSSTTCEDARRLNNITAANTIRILVSTDNHVGYGERDPKRGNDSWKTFNEVMALGKERDVDMVLLAGDLFHENKPSRQSMYQVIRSLRLNCYGEKPCELEMLSDGSETFSGSFNHVNYEDPDINVAMPVFSIHGNHDDPSGEGHLAALDLLQISGLINYYGRTPESDNILVKPVLLQKGHTKLALYGMSNVRDERLFRTFRDGNVKFFQPNTQKDDWFNIMSVHQNHHAYTETGYLPENFLPSFMDLVIWGHEHECKIDPRTNPETGFKVMQPGSSVATSLVAGEAVPKRVAILSINGRDMQTETIRLKTVRPFIVRELTLADSHEMREVARLPQNKARVHRFLDDTIQDMIAEAKQSWHDARLEDEIDDDEECPLPLIRLRVEYTAPEGGKFEFDNPQRFSRKFLDRVANVNDVVQYHRKRAAQRTIKGTAEMPEASVMAQMSIDSVKVDKLVEEFLTAQSLSILSQNNFSDAVGQFVDKDDRHAMEAFVDEQLKDHVTHLLNADDDDEANEMRFQELMEARKAMLEEAFERGEIKRSKLNGTRKAKPQYWDSDDQGHWEDNPASIIREEGDGEEQDSDAASTVTSRAAPRGRGSTRARGGRTVATNTTKKTDAAVSKKAPAKPTVKSKKKPFVDDSEEDEDRDVIMLSDDDDDDGDQDTNPNFADDQDEEENDRSQSSSLFVRPTSTRSKPAAAPRKPPPVKAPTSISTTRKPPATGRGSILQYTQPSSQSQTMVGSRASTGGARSTRNAAPATASRRLAVHEPSEDEIDDDDDAFEPPPPSATLRSHGRR
nr:double-strand break repair protein mus-23 [Quercus suber]